MNVFARRVVAGFVAVVLAVTWAAPDAHAQREDDERSLTGTLGRLLKAAEQLVDEIETEFEQEFSTLREARDEDRQASQPTAVVDEGGEDDDEGDEDRAEGERREDATADAEDTRRRRDRDRDRDDRRRELRGREWWGDERPRRGFEDFRDAPRRGPAARPPRFGERDAWPGGQPWREAPGQRLAEIERKLDELILLVRRLNARLDREAPGVERPRRDADERRRPRDDDREDRGDRGRRSERFNAPLDGRFDRPSRERFDRGDRPDREQRLERRERRERTRDSEDRDDRDQDDGDRLDGDTI